MQSSSASAASGFPLPKLGDEGGNVLIGHRGMMAARQLRRPRQQVVQMAAPPGGVLAVAEALGLGRVQNLFNPSAHPRGGFGLRRPDRLQDRQHVIGGDGIHRLGAQGSGVGLQRRFPLSLVLLVPETRRKRLPHVVGHLAKRGNATVALALVNWVEPLGNLPARAGGLLAGIGKGNAGGAAEPHLLGPAAPGEAQTHLRAPVSETIK